ncbi:MAG TPA: DUF72 domain-containing protein [Candidatus Limnocylindrales bacterium]|nr:DUF72 domain-containing protein [Candidatus Limnocylindrales bacterium]
MAGRLYAGTSGFAYPDWAPRFYPPGARGAGLLRAYAARLPAVELNNTFYRQPRPATVGGWLAATPGDFRFTVKAQRGGAVRALLGDAAATLAWLLPPYRLFGGRLGAVLYRVPQEIARDDRRLDALLRVWPAELPMAIEFQHPSWQVDEVHGRCREAGAAVCATERDESVEPPMLRLTADFLYLRLRREHYDEAAIEAWAARLEPFLADGRDAYVFFRHDAHGAAAERALALAGAVARRLDPAPRG